jgi:hypothetical protein
VLVIIASPMFFDLFLRRAVVYLGFLSFQHRRYHKIPKEHRLEFIQTVFDFTSPDAVVVVVERQPTKRTVSCCVGPNEGRQCRRKVLQSIFLWCWWCSVLLTEPGGHLVNNSVAEPHISETICQDPKLSEAGVNSAATLCELSKSNVVVLDFQVHAVADCNFLPVDPEQVRAEYIVVNVRQLDHTTGSFLPFVTTGRFEELGFVCEQAFRHMEAGRVLCAFVDDDSELLIEVRNAEEVLTDQSRV